ARRSGSTPAGTGVSQSPAGASQASPGSTVTIVVAKKPPTSKITVPAVIGESAGQARGALLASGLNVSETTQTVKIKATDGIVLGQSPSGGTKVDKGATVTIIVGSYKQPTTPTTPTPPT